MDNWNGEPYDDDPDGRGPAPRIRRTVTVSNCKEGGKAILLAEAGNPGFRAVTIRKLQAELWRVELWFAGSDEYLQLTREQEIHS